MSDHILHHLHITHRFLFAGKGWVVVFLLLLTACGVAPNQVRIKGQYEGMDQSDFLMFSPEGVTMGIDTLHIRGGEFDSLYDVTKEGTLRIIYPNNASELVIWVHGGEKISIRGEAIDLWHVSVDGNEENELYTEFRSHTEANDTLGLRRQASSFIRQHPSSRVASYLLQSYFINTDGVPADSIEALYQVIREALPEDPDVAALGGQVHQRTVLAVGRKMPSFDFVTADSVHHDLKEYMGSTLFLYFWAGWQTRTTVLHQQLLQIKDELENPAQGTAQQKVAILGYSLDVDSMTLRVNMTEDERKRIPTHCDYQGFSSPLAAQLGVRSVPYIVVVGPDGKIQHTFTDEASLKACYHKK